MSLKRTVWPKFTYSALRPVSGWVRTTGCSAAYCCFASCLAPSRTRSSRVRVTSAFVELFTATSPSSMRRIPSERRNFAGDQHGGHRRLVEIGRVGVPQPAEIHLLGFQLDHRRDLRKSLDALDERIFDHLAEAPGHLQEPLRRERLVAEEDDQVLEPGAPDRCDRFVAQLVCEIDVQDLGAQGACHGSDIDAVVSHLPCLSRNYSAKRAKAGVIEQRRRPGSGSNLTP